MLYPQQNPGLKAPHVWNFADFQTSQGIRRADSMSHKGVCTRAREPKLAAPATVRLY